MGSVQTSADVSLDVMNNSSSFKQTSGIERTLFDTFTEKQHHLHQNRPPNHADKSILKELFAAADIPFKDSDLLDVGQLSKLLQAEFVKNITESSIILKDECFSFGEKTSIFAPIQVQISLKFDVVSVWMDEYFKKTNHTRCDAGTTSEHEFEKRLTTFFEEVSKFVLNGIQSGELLKIVYANAGVFENTVRYQLYERLKRQHLKTKYEVDKTFTESTTPIPNTYKIAPYLNIPVFDQYFFQVADGDRDKIGMIRDCLRDKIFKERRDSGYLNSILALSGDGKNIMCFKQQQQQQQQRTHQRSSKSMDDDDGVAKHKNDTKVGTSVFGDKEPTEHFDNLVSDTCILDAPYTSAFNIVFVLDEIIARNTSSDKLFDVSIVLKNFTQSLKTKTEKHNVDVLKSKLKKERDSNVSKRTNYAIFEETLQNYDDFLLNEADFYSNLTETTDDINRVDDVLNLLNEADGVHSETQSSIRKKSCLYNIFSDDAKMSNLFDSLSSFKHNVSESTNIVSNSMFTLSNHFVHNNMTHELGVQIYKYNEDTVGSDVIIRANGVRFDVCDCDLGYVDRVVTNVDDVHLLKTTKKSKKSINIDQYDRALGEDFYVAKRKRMQKKKTCLFNTDFETIPRVLYTDSQQSTPCRGRYIPNLNIIDTTVLSISATDSNRDMLRNVESNMVTMTSNMSKTAETIVTCILKNYKLFFDTDIVPTLYNSNMFQSKREEIGIKRAKCIQIGYLQYDKKTGYISLVIQSKKDNRTASDVKGNEHVYEIKNIVAIRSDVCDDIEEQILSKKYDDLEVLNYESFKMDVSVRYLEQSLVPAFKKEMIRNILTRTYPTVETHDVLCSERSSKHSTSDVILDEDIATNHLHNTNCVSNEDDTISELLINSVLESEAKMQNDRMRFACENALRSLCSNITIQFTLELKGLLYNDFNPSLNDD